MLTFEALRRSNTARCEEVFHPLSAWSLTDWACALAGEAGEACNVIKKMRRLDGADRKDDSEVRRGMLAFDAVIEIADVVIYADLLAARLGFSLEDAVRYKFNKVSRERGSKVEL